jgi:hypothetical protein
MENVSEDVSGRKSRDVDRKEIYTLSESQKTC